MGYQTTFRLKKGIDGDFVSWMNNVGKEDLAKAKTIFGATCMTSIDEYSDKKSNIIDKYKIWDSISSALKQYVYLLREDWKINLESRINKDNEISFCGWEYSDGHDCSFESLEDYMAFLMEQIYPIAISRTKGRFEKDNDDFNEKEHQIYEYINEIEDEVWNIMNHIFIERYRNSKDADEDDKDEETKEIDSLVNDATNNEIVTKGRSELCRLMTLEANKLVPEYGIDLIDIVPRQIKYSDELTESVFNRMIKDRNQVAQAYRSLGEGKKAEWLGKLESDKRTIASEAYRKSEEIKGNADAQAAAIYAAAYNKDPEFYAFWKSMESYKTNLKNYPATFSTNMDYFKYLYNSKGKR